MNKDLCSYWKGYEADFEEVNKAGWPLCYLAEAFPEDDSNANEDDAFTLEEYGVGFDFVDYNYLGLTQELAQFIYPLLGCSNIGPEVSKPLPIRRHIYIHKLFRP